MFSLRSYKGKSRRGFTLTELAIVLGVMGTILSAIWVASARVSASNKAQKANQQVQLILAGYRSLWAARGVDVGAPPIAAGTWVDVTCMGINGGFLPADMIQTGTVCAGNPQVPNLFPLTPWGTPSWVQVFGHFSWNGIIIQYAALSQSACVNFASAVAKDSSIIWESINGNTLGGGTPLGAAGVFTSTAINADCVAGNGNVVAVMWAAQ